MLEKQTFVISHPYYPQGVEIANYQPNAAPLYVLLGAFGSILAIVVSTSLYLATRANRRLRRRDRCILGWFVLCGFLHCFFEGYYVLHHNKIPGSQSLFSQLWKEYALSDSRYLTSDPFMLCIESFTAFVWGPLCWTIAVGIMRGHYIRHALQIIMSVGHLYGVILYYGTCYFEYKFRGISHSRPEVQYYWVYYVGFNIPWVIIPLALLFASLKNTYHAFTGLEAVVRIVRDYQAAELRPRRKEKTG